MLGYPHDDNAGLTLTTRLAFVARSTRHSHHRYRVCLGLLLSLRPKLYYNTNKAIAVCTLLPTLRPRSKTVATGCVPDRAGNELNMASCSTCPHLVLASETLKCLCPDSALPQMQTQVRESDQRSVNYNRLTEERRTNPAVADRRHHNTYLRV